MIDHTTILNGALVDYNDWVIKQNAQVVGAPAELRGIFYNKLIARLKEDYVSADLSLRSAIHPEHFIISFIPQGYITSLSVVKDRHAYGNPIRDKILDGLEEALLTIDVTDYQDKVSYGLSKVILDLKKSLSYGREQTTR